MKLESKKILVGIFSYNEGENLRRMYFELKKQCIGLDSYIILIDESDDPYSIGIVDEIKQSQGSINIRDGHKKRGKVHGYNLLYNYFLNSDYQILLHFDADHTLSEETVLNLSKSIESGFNIATCLNKPLKGTNLFQRALYCMLLPSTIQKENKIFNLPLVGHNGAYDRKAVELIGEIPSGGIDEEAYILSRVFAENLSRVIVTNAISYFVPPGNLSDYIKSTKRVYGRVRTFAKRYRSIGSQSKIEINSISIVNSIYSNPPIRLIIESLFSDIIAAIFVPYIFLVRWAAMESAGDNYTSDTWETIQTSKIFKKE